MKLSEAIMLGSATCRMKAGNLNSCAMGAAANALGIPKYDGTYVRLQAIQICWPWIVARPAESGYPLDDFCNRIVTQFDNAVCGGRMSLEALVDYVKSVEPSCGECNRFDCTCRPEQAIPSTADTLELVR